MELEKSLILNKYFLRFFGCENISELKDKLSGAREGFHGEGRSYFADILIGLENLKISQDELLRYDLAIEGYSERLCKNRRENISLKYFQYLAVLCSETFLDRYFNRRKEFLNELNSFLDVLNEEIIAQEDKFAHFIEVDLKKLAYWMATGSGKTLVMHINYWQFLKYKMERLDNIILVTPNEGLSKQHFNEMQKSGIPCRLYSGGTGIPNLLQDEVLIIDIHKLTKEKKGEGVRVEVDYFEGNNLVFIDEGHKGAGTEEKTWKKLREALAKTGFIFEYSATFGQVISPQDKDLLEEYSKAIIFDYSYKYFYTDGYGKDFYVYNLSETSFQEKFRQLILTGNLLSFYEQILLFENYKNELREYLIEKPLWAFIGSKVSGAGINSDVLKIVEFLKEIIENRKLLSEGIEKILNGKSGINDPQGQDIFKDRFEELRKDGWDIKDIYERIFDSRTGLLSLHELKSTEGEIGLKMGEGDYFGVINIGDVGGFKKLVEARGIDMKPDNITPSLFEKLNEHDSHVHILIGAKKFIEGWDSWRVCSMGLINMGKGEGPQIIQLFGRGVRLKGRNLSLKRSEEKKYGVRALETLNIFGLNADYINAFLEAIRKEEVEYEEVQLPLKFNKEKRWTRGLYILHTPEDFDFSRHFIRLEIDMDILRRVKVDLRPRVGLAHGLEVSESGAKGGRIVLESGHIDLLDWDMICLKMINYKISKGYVNLAIQKGILQDIMKSNGYELYAFPEQIRPQEFSDLVKLQEVVLLILKNYIDNFYNLKLRQAESKKLRPIYLAKENENLAYGHYTLRIRKDRKKEIREIKRLIEQADRLYEEDIEEIPTVHFDRHLYTPLVLYRKEKDYIKSIPPGLNEGEAEFIKMLRNYLKAHNTSFTGEEIFLLRNLSQRGVKFFQTSGYYPDFILWRKKRDKQSLVFIDPKGIRHVEDEKVQLCKTIKDLEKTINKKDLTLESFVLSVSKYDDIKKTYAYTSKDKEDLEKDHVLFIKDDEEKAIEKLFEIVP